MFDSADEFDAVVFDSFSGALVQFIQPVVVFDSVTEFDALVFDSFSGALMPLAAKNIVNTARTMAIMTTMLMYFVYSPSLVVISQ
jgi:hypothetical protein